VIGGEKLIQNYTPAERRGREACIQIRDKINSFRWRGQEPKAVWINQRTADDMCALWTRMCRGQFDGQIQATIAGVPLRVGSTGGHDYLFEYYDTQEESERRRRAHAFKPVDNPLQGTH